MTTPAWSSSPSTSCSSPRPSPAASACPAASAGSGCWKSSTRITEGQGTRKDLRHHQGDLRADDEQRRCAAWASARPGRSWRRCGSSRRSSSPTSTRRLCPAGQCKPLVRAKCINTCPAGVDTPAYLALIAQGRYAEGLAIHRERNPFAADLRAGLPGVLRDQVPPRRDRRAVAVRLVKRFMADHETREALDARADRHARAARGRRQDRRSPSSAPARPA